MFDHHLVICNLPSIAFDDLVMSINGLLNLVCFTCYVSRISYTMPVIMNGQNEQGNWYIFKILHVVLQTTSLQVSIHDCIKISAQGTLNFILECLYPIRGLATIYIILSSE